MPARHRRTSRFIERVVLSLSLSLSTRKMMTAVAATTRRSRRPSQNQPPTDKGLDVAAPDGTDSDGNGKQLEKEENRRIQESRGLDVAVPEGSDSLKKRKRFAQNDGDGKQKESSVFKQQQVERKENRRIKERCKDGDGKQKESSAFKQQQVERRQLLREENRRIRERRGFDFGDIPPIGPIDGRLFESCWAEKSLYPAPKVYEDMAKIGLKSYNRQFDTSYQFTKILRVYFFQTPDDCTHNLIFCRAEDKSVASPEDFMLTGSSISGVAMVSSCMKEKDLRYYTGLDCWRSRCIVYEYYVLRDQK